MFAITKEVIENRIRDSHLKAVLATNVEDQLFLSYVNKGYESSILTQFKELFIRSIKITLRDADTMNMRFWSAVATSLLIGAVYFKVGDDPEKIVDNMAMLFFLLLFIFFGGVLPTILSFPMEMNIIRREHLNHWYSMKVYYFATTLAFLPAQIIFPTIALTVVYFMTFQPFEGKRYFLFATILVLVAIFAESYGLIFGCSLAPNSAVFIAPSSAIPFIIFSGFLISLKNVPIYLRWMNRVSFYRYGFEGIMNAIYLYDRNFTCTAPTCLFPDAASVFKTYGLEEDVYPIDAIVLFSMTLVVRTAAFFVLWLKLWSLQ
jgi:ABC-type multidrug transport system permease subunit